MMLPPTSPVPRQLTLPLDDLLPALPDLPPQDLIPPRHLWPTLSPLLRDQLSQRLIILLQEVLHAPDRS
jgi:hypothetical protein